MEKFCVNRFFFTLVPPQPVQAFISDLKNQVHTALGHGFQDEFSPAHIALFKYPDKPEPLLHDAEWLISALLPFRISVTGLATFNQGANKTIYLQITCKSPVPDLTKFLGGEAIPPHIILARNLDADDFARAWESLQRISYPHYFSCNDIIVLKREPNRWNRYLHVARKSDRGFEEVFNDQVCQAIQI